MVCLADLLDHAGCRFGFFPMRKAEVADLLLVSASDEVLLKAEPLTPGGPQLGAKSVIGRRQDSGSEAERAGEVLGDLGESHSL